jgi:DTW domain-containing protein YfiP
MRRVYPNNHNPRCPICGTRPDLCFCADLPTFPTRLRFVFVQHAQEACKPTNSARLACRLLSQASIVPWNRIAPPEFDSQAILLYPASDASLLEPSELSTAAAIVVPDGTWSQASRIASVLGHGSIRKRSLPPGAVSTWGVRQASSLERVSSAQAVAAVLGMDGQPDAANAVVEALAEAGRRILSMRGIVREDAHCQISNTRSRGAGGGTDAENVF